MIKNYSSFIDRTKSSAIRELLKLTSQPDIISFAGGLPDPNVFPIEIINDIIANILQNKSKVALQYGATEGVLEFKQELVKFISKSEGINLKPENILVTSASQQGLDLIGKAFINVSDPILVELPSYLGALQVFQSYGADIIGVKSDDDGVLIDDFAAKLDLLKRQNATCKFVYLVPDFQNPTGVTMSVERRHKLIEISKHYDLPIIEDSPYRQVRFEGDHCDMLYKLSNYDNVISLFTFSKIFVPGLRLGYMIGPEEAIMKMSTLKQSLDLCTSPLNQLIASEFLKGGYFDSHVKEIIGIYKKKKDVMLRALNEFMPEGVSWTTPEGGLFLWVRLPEYMDANQMFYNAVDEKVAYVIGSVFHCDNSGLNTLRLNFSYPSEEEIYEGIKRLAKVVKDRLKTPSKA
ncbi:MAG: PLP-dependent aminotransferase family protein [Candidatus Gastranaerophilales bacterium]|nr:PLP-dependent aminotransferase family protein [Candidatus Gastranaerophilales bacterium]